jgi:S1-C subfamily serine protease
MRLLQAACGFALVATASLAPAQSGDPGLPHLDPIKQRRTAVVDVFQACKDAVVNISSTQIVRLQTPDTLFEQLFDLPVQPREYRATSVGSGFVIHPAGYIVTNAHVVARTADRKVIFPDKREFEAQIVATDTSRDLAILKINADRPLKTLLLGRSDDLMVGETVIAIGNPLGYSHTVTAGVISATDREIRVNQQVTFRGLIQTDASINPGNSGGPLLNVLGELIGVNTAIRGDAQNIGFAIPVNTLREVLPELLDVERRYRIHTGLAVIGDAAGPGAKVVAVEAKSPAEAAGLRVGDLIRAVDQQRVDNAIDFHIALINRRRGEALRIRFDRDGKRSDTTLTVAARIMPDGAVLLSERLGVTAEPLSQRTAQSMGMPELQALVVTQVEDESPAAQIGIRRGDMIENLDRRPIRGLEDAGETLERLPGGKAITIAVLRIKNRVLYRIEGEIVPR